MKSLEQKPTVPKKEMPKPTSGMQSLLEHVSGLDQVKTFLRSKLLDKYKNEKEAERVLETYCEENECHLWRVEPQLMTDLMQNPDDEMKNRLRKFIYAVSWRSHNRPEPKLLREEEDYLNAFVQRSAKAAAILKDKLDEEQVMNRRLGEKDTEDLEKAEAIRIAVEDEKKLGPVLKPEVEAIEQFLSRAYERFGTDFRRTEIIWPLISKFLPKGQDMEKVGERALRDAILNRLSLKEETGQELIIKKQILNDLVDIQHLRVLRDFLYFKYLYPNWMRTQQAA